MTVAYKFKNYSSLRKIERSEGHILLSLTRNYSIAHLLAMYLFIMNSNNLKIKLITTFQIMGQRSAMNYNNCVVEGNF